jgi:hypothetical protein
MRHCNTDNKTQVKRQTDELNTQAWSLGIIINILVFLIVNKSYFQIQTNNIAWLSTATLWLLGFLIIGYIFQIYFKKFVVEIQSSMSNEDQLFSARITTLLVRFVYIGIMYLVAYKFFLL